MVVLQCIILVLLNILPKFDSLPYDMTSISLKNLSNASSNPLSVSCSCDKIANTCDPYCCCDPDCQKVN